MASVSTSLSFLFVFGLMPLGAQENQAHRHPNIVVLYADDAGYADFGFQRQPAPELARRTPHIDSIAKDGVTCTQAYMSGCVCSPSRAGILTGRYQQRFGHESNLPPGSKLGLPLSEKTVADRMHALGYRTGLVGKWHLGYEPAYHPNRRGFDWFYGLLQGSRPYVPMPKPTPHRVLQENGEATDEGGYVTDRLGDAAVRFIEAEAKREGEPFFLFVSFTSPHGPLQPKDEDYESLGDIENERRRKYAGLVRSLDDNVGKILAALRENDLDGKTLVVFTNDNGGQTQTGAINTPLRGRKGMLLEGGIRVPLAMRYPGRIEKGSELSMPVISLDLLPTFVKLGGGEIDPEWKLDGADVSPWLLGTRAEPVARDLLWRAGGSSGEGALRHGRYKLHREQRDAAFALYDLETDIGEARDIAGDNAELVKEMAERFQAWDAQLIEPLWGAGSMAQKR
ncbi:MAG: sulfatase-like hydrolase/transferase [Planctomycetes bacterium]|nr:sulfatase-like hydrolase/transferase [Planctomycetota bacterium]MCB9919026.1 sulfatase-like hydrolase/transferase [Planctomycetota bacterium]